MWNEAKYYLLEIDNGRLICTNNRHKLLFKKGNLFSTATLNQRKIIRRGHLIRRNLSETTLSEQRKSDLCHVLNSVGLFASDNVYIMWHIKLSCIYTKSKNLILKCKHFQMIQQSMHPICTIFSLGFMLKLLKITFT